MKLLTDELRGWIGKQARYEAREPIGAAAIRYFALAIGDDDKLYVSDRYAKDYGYPGVIAPTTFVCETNQYAHRAVSDEGYVGHRWELPITGCSEVRGGHEYEFGRPVLPTDRLTVIWRIADIVEKTSSAGVPMLVVTSEAEYLDEHGEFLARNRETIVYRPLAGT